MWTVPIAAAAPLHLVSPVVRLTSSWLALFRLQVRTRNDSGSLFDVAVTEWANASVSWRESLGSLVEPPWPNKPHAPAATTTVSSHLLAAEMAGSPYLVPFGDLQQEISKDVHEHIRSMYEAHYRAHTPDGDDVASAKDEAEQHMGRFLDALKKPPRTTFVRVNHVDSSQEASPASSSLLATSDCVRVDAVIRFLTETVSEWVRQQQQLLSDDAKDNDPTVVRVHVGRHDVLPDVVWVRIEHNSNRPTGANCDALHAGPEDDAPATQLHKRKRVICDRRCGEAIMRGSNVFVRGILCADPGILPGDVLDVFADVPACAGGSSTDAGPSRTTTTRGLHVDKYGGRAVFLGRGVAECSRPDFFRLEAGVAVRMSLLDRVGPILPPLPAVPGGMLQNVPSILVGHVLDPQPGQTILDMCAAPGGKTLHVASLVRNQATIVACDRSRSKMVAARLMFREQGATCIFPLAGDSAQLVESPASNGTQKSVVEVSEGCLLSTTVVPCTRTHAQLSCLCRFFPYRRLIRTDC
jgi:16S rRNA methyltransferase RsmB/F